MRKVGMGLGTVVASLGTLEQFHGLSEAPTTGQGDAGVILEIRAGRPCALGLLEGLDALLDLVLEQMQHPEIQACLKDVRIFLEFGIVSFLADDSAPLMRLCSPTRRARYRLEK